MMTKLSKLDRSIKGKIAIITGAASGIGRATAYLFADEGAHLAIADVNAQGLEETAAAIQAAGGTVSSWVVDLADSQAITRLVKDTVASYGGIDILVNNAGIAILTDFSTDPAYEDAWNTTFAVNLEAHYKLCRAALPHLRKHQHGRIINIASTEGFGASPMNSPYVAAKHGVIGLTKALAMELSKDGITVNAVCPGPINTGITKMFKDEDKAKFAARRLPIKRYGDPEEIAHGVLNFALPSASFMTGATLLIDGGLRAQNI